MLAPPGVAAARRVLGAQRGRHCPIDKLRAGIAGIYERQGAAATSYYEGGGLRPSGYSSNNGVFYMLSDHLKSTSALVARNGVLNVKYFYFPYGARRGVPFNTITAKRFTGQYHEASLPGGGGLSFYNARW